MVEIILRITGRLDGHAIFHASSEEKIDGAVSVAVSAVAVAFVSRCKIDFLPVCRSFADGVVRRQKTFKERRKEVQGSVH